VSLLSDPTKQPVSAVVPALSAAGGGGGGANRGVAKAAAVAAVAPATAATSSHSAHLSAKTSKSGAAASAAKDAHEQAAKDVGKLVKEEAHSVGSVPREVYLGYLRAVGWKSSIIMILGICLAQATQIGSSMWIAYWASQSSKPADSGDVRSAGFYVGIYTALSVLQILLTLTSNVIGFAGSVNGSAAMHSDFMRGMMMSPQSFFDSTPLGRISNRVAKDFSQIDTVLMTILQMVVRAFIGLLGQLIIIGINTTYVLVIFVPILMIFLAVQAYFRSAAIQLKRLDAVTRSPVYAHFSECLSGISTIRAYGAQPRMSVINAQKLDCNQKVSYIMTLTSRWLSVRLEFLGGMLILATAINCVIQRGNINPSSAGVSLSYALMITT
jgi:ATP-binding cassette subfamily C (CFTR/MRP) protein 3